MSPVHESLSQGFGLAILAQACCRVCGPPNCYQGAWALLRVSSGLAQASSYGEFKSPSIEVHLKPLLGSHLLATISLSGIQTQDEGVEKLLQSHIPAPKQEVPWGLAGEGWAIRDIVVCHNPEAPFIQDCVCVRTIEVMRITQLLGLWKTLP